MHACVYVRPPGRVVHYIVDAGSRVAPVRGGVSPKHGPLWRTSELLRRASTSTRRSNNWTPSSSPSSARQACTRCPSTRTSSLRSQVRSGPSSGPRTWLGKRARASDSKAGLTTWAGFADRTVEPRGLLGDCGAELPGPATRMAGQALQAHGLGFHRARKSGGRGQGKEALGKGSWRVSSQKLSLPTPGRWKAEEVTRTSAAAAACGPAHWRRESLAGAHSGAGW